MSDIARSLWRDEAGVILSAELVMILTIGVLGLIVGLVNLQNALLGEFNDLGNAFRSLNQSYATPAFRGCWKACMLTSYTSGSCFADVYEPGCLATDVPANAAGCYGLELNSGFSCCPPFAGSGPGVTTSIPPSPEAKTPEATPGKPADDQVVPPRKE